MSIAYGERAGGREVLRHMPPDVQDAAYTLLAVREWMAFQRPGILYQNDKHHCFDHDLVPKLEHPRNISKPGPIRLLIEARRTIARFCETTFQRHLDDGIPAGRYAQVCGFADDFRLAHVLVSKEG